MTRFGDILAECRRLYADVVVATCTPEKLEQAGGHRYRAARRPDLYEAILGQDHISQQKVVWLEPTNNC